MDNANIMIRWNLASEQEIAEHLRRCSDSFSPPLATYVKIDDYAAKIREKAETAEVWADEKLVGLAAAYLNDLSTKVGFVTNLSVEREFQRKGLAANLMRFICDAAIKKTFRFIKLEVYKENDAAIHLYGLLGFAVTEDNGSQLVMRKRLDPHASE